MTEEFDPYPKFSDEHKVWFMALLEGMVKQPEAANFGRIRGGNDLEIVIKVAQSDESVFTPEVCKALKVLLAAVTGVLSPVVYLNSKPHPEAQESIDAARSGC